MLLRDRGPPGLPAVSELVQVRQRDVGHDRVDGRHREQPVEDRLGTRLVEGGEGVGQLAACGVDLERGAERFGGPVVRRASAAASAGSQALREVSLHAAHPRKLIERVEAQAAGRAHGVKQAVAALPGAQQLRADAGAPAQLADSRRVLSVTVSTIQDVYMTLTATAQGAIVLYLYSIYTGDETMKKLTSRRQSS